MKKIFILAAAAILIYSIQVLPAQENTDKYKGQTSVNSVLATINGMPVTLLDVILDTGSQEWELAHVYSGQRLMDEITKLRAKVLEEIISRKLVYREYMKQPFEIPNQRIEMVLDRYMKVWGCTTREDLARKARENGTSIESLREKAREYIAVGALLQKNCYDYVVVTPKEVYDEYVTEKEQYSKPARVDFQLLQIDKGGITDAMETANKIAHAAQKADETAFLALMRSYSTIQNPEQRGIIKGVPTAKLRQEFRKAIEGQQANTVVGPVETPEAVFFLRLTAVWESETIPFEDVSGKIEDKLMSAKMEEARRAYEQKLRANAVIRKVTD